ncbi:MAG: hypothetical protein HY039_03730 [Nitrospirae bacterium]|nr:hypothetical protein [Nitrospirota bacterium]
MGYAIKPLTQPTWLKDVIGCAGYKGPRRSLKEMEAAIARGARESR